MRQSRPNCNTAKVASSAPDGVALLGQEATPTSSLGYGLRDLQLTQGGSLKADAAGIELWRGSLAFLAESTKA
jgi:hypothetical protein